MNAWAHVPNAVYIDRVLASVVAHPEVWLATFSDTSFVIEKYFKAMREKPEIDTKVFSALSLELSNKVLGVDMYAERLLVCDIFEVLLAYDDCGYMLDSEPEELIVLATLGDDRAMLLLPACKALRLEKELCV